MNPSRHPHAAADADQGDSINFDAVRVADHRKPPVKKRPRRPPAERFEVRKVTGRGTREAVSWHVKKERAIQVAKRVGGHVVWTHSEDTYLGSWIDNADIVWPAD